MVRMRMFPLPVVGADRSPACDHHLPGDGPDGKPNLPPPAAPVHALAHSPPCCRASMRLCGNTHAGRSRTRLRLTGQGSMPASPTSRTQPAPHPAGPTCAVWSAAARPMMGDKCVGMPVAELVLGLEEGDLFGMLP